MAESQFVKCRCYFGNRMSEVEKRNVIINVAHIVALDSSDTNSQFGTAHLVGGVNYSIERADFETLVEQVLHPLVMRGMLEHL